MKHRLSLTALALLLFLAISPLAAQTEEENGVQSPAELEPAPVMWKSPKLAMGASAIFPGLGQLYNEEPIKTLVVFVWESYYIATVLREGQRADFYRRRAASLADGETWNGLDRAELRRRFKDHEKKETDYIWYGSALILASVLDAYVFAHLYRHETDDIRSPRRGVAPLLRPETGAYGIQLSWDF